jgi:hypothetical protein
VNALKIHHEIVHRPVWFDAALPSEAGELGVVAYAMQKRVKEDGLAVGAGLAHGAGGELEGFVPVDVGVEKFLEDRHGMVVRGEEGLHGVKRDVGVVGDGQLGEPFRIAKLNGDDVLKQLGNTPRARDIAGFGEEFGMGGEEPLPAGCGLFVPGDEFVRRESGFAYGCSSLKA